MNPVVISLIACIIAGISLIFSVIIFVFHDRKIKTQEAIINDYHIKQISKEESKKDDAILRIFVDWIDKGTLALVINNNGLSDAHDITIRDLNEEGVLFQEISDKFPIEHIYSHDSEQIEFLAFNDMPHKVRVLLSWTDNNGNHSEKRIINIC